MKLRLVRESDFRVEEVENETREVVTRQNRKRTNGRILLALALLTTFIAAESIADTRPPVDRNGAFDHNNPGYPPDRTTHPPLLPPYGGDTRGLLRRLAQTENALSDLTMRVADLESRRRDLDRLPPPPPLNYGQPPLDNPASFYCSAQCGNEANTLYGGRGRSQTEAKQAAVEEVRKHYVCSNLQVVECSQE